jgi:hypothetical protein
MEGCAKKVWKKEKKDLTEPALLEMGRLPRSPDLFQVEASFGIQRAR